MTGSMLEESAFGVFLNLGSPAAAAICSQAGLDWILIDLEHGSGSEASLVGDIQAARTGGAAVWSASSRTSDCAQVERSTSVPTG